MKRISEVKMIEFNEFGDERGQLVVVEENKNIPFDLKRVFYIYNSDEGIVRGNHANLETEFVLICVSGKAKVKVLDGIESKVYELDGPQKGLYIPKMVWKEMYDFTKNTVLLVMASELYNENEYIRNFDEYLEKNR